MISQARSYETSQTSSPLLSSERSYLTTAVSTRSIVFAWSKVERATMFSNNETNKKVKVKNTSHPTPSLIIPSSWRSSRVSTMTSQALRDVPGNRYLHVRTTLSLKGFIYFFRFPMSCWVILKFAHFLCRIRKRSILSLSCFWLFATLTTFHFGHSIITFTNYIV